MRVSIVFGTRPEIIKMAPVIKQCELLGLEFFIIHTGQHYSYRMDKVFLEELKLPDPKYHLGVGAGSHAQQTGKMLIGIEEVLMKEKPSIVLVQGDTNSTLAGAIAAAKLGIKVGHVEAGLRSYDWGMPEEINRVLADHCSVLLFAPTKNSREILFSEGLPEERIFVTGNTIVDIVLQRIEAKKHDALDELGLSPKAYFLTTIHRQENVDDKKRFRRILDGLKKITEEFKAPMIYPIHPRSRKRIEEFNLTASGIELIDPINFTTFLQLEKNARLVLTDSGGVQEETCVLKVPCVTLRDNTERPETLDVGSNILAGTTPSSILECARTMLNRSNNWKNPFGNGTAGKKIVETLRNTLN
jgi:UDP-N-acetylglucosamine 2-epimerase (non-hydrolysing)